MILQSVVVLLFGVFNVVGGIIGFMKASSTASLIAGGISGILLFVCSFGVRTGNKVAIIGALVISILLCGRFLPALFTSFKVMPNLIIVVFAIATIALLIPLLMK